MDTILAIALITFGALFAYWKWSTNYWHRRKIPYIKNRVLRDENLGLSLTRWYKDLKLKNISLGGVYVHGNPMCVITDPFLIKKIMAEDFRYFVDHGTYYNKKSDPLTAHLFNLEGARWKILRKKMLSIFSTNKMKLMFELLVNCADQLLINIEKYSRGKAVDIKEVFSKYATDTIGSCAFGLECNSFDDDAEFRKYGRKVFASSPMKDFKRHFRYALPALSHFFGLRFVERDVSDFFIKAVKDTVEYRERNNMLKDDFMALLIKLRYDPDINLTITEVASQAFGLFIAGYETSSILMTYALYELSKNQKLQDKAREEIQKVLEKHSEKWTYEIVEDLKYLGQVLDETLRFYPPFLFINRKCTEEWNIPNTTTKLKIGDRVLIPTYAIHHDPDYYPDPEEFNPDRFHEDNKEDIVPYTYLPFGAGYRACIGVRFGLIQSKLALAKLLQKFKFSVNAKTIQPLGISGGTVINPKNTIFLNIQAI